MKKIYILIFILSFSSCGKRELIVPKVSMTGKEEIRNNSIIWMFLNKENKLDVNEKNRISSTHWFFNIDKRLLLKDIIPEIIRLKLKHSEKSPHNTKPMNNYYTYINAQNNHLSFYQFDSIKYKIIQKMNFPKDHGDTLVIHINSSSLRIPTINKETTIIQTVFDANMNFQEYFETKSLFSKIINKENLSSIEYISK